MSNHTSTQSVLSADTLVGNKVVNMKNDDLGKIDAIMLDPGSGSIAYAVLSFGGFLGLGNKLFAVPWEALRLDKYNHEFILDVEKERLKDAPGFDQDNWPDMANLEWAASLHTHYATRPYWERHRQPDI